MAIRRAIATVTGAAGGSGAATAFAYTDKPVEGEVIGVYLSYTDSPPNTTDVTVEEANSVPSQTVIVVSNANTNGWFYPMAQAKNQAATDITGMGRPVVVADTLKVTIAGADNNDGVVATIVFDDGRDTR